jgi:eukaryotic-like serine/threonine-protein kinase
VSSSVSNKIINIAERRQGARPIALSAPDRPDVERVRRALAGRFADFKQGRIFGDVESYLVCDARGETLELKVLSADATSNANARALFLSDARAAAKLVHPNISTTTEPEEILGVHFCTVEHKQEARTLRELLDHDGWFDVASAARIADQIASALDHAHQIRVLHLRLQPECVLVEADGWVTIADFGTEAAGNQGSKMPAAPYASPEQAARGAVDHRSDLYSIGAVLYEMLTDRTPFDSSDADYIRTRQLSFTPAPPHLISMDVPETVSSVVMRLLEPEPDRRFATAIAFQSALDDAQ